MNQIKAGSIVTGPSLPEPIEVLAVVPMGGSLKVRLSFLHNRVGPGGVIATGDNSGIVCIWKHGYDGSSRVFTLGSSQERPVVSARFNREGSKLAVLRRDETAVRLWDLRLLSDELAELGLDEHD